MFRYVRLLREVRVNQPSEGFDRFVLISAIRNNLHCGTFDNTEGQNAEQALRIHASLFLLNPDAALELVGLLDKERCGSGVKPNLVIDNYIFAALARLSLSAS